MPAPSRAERSAEDAGGRFGPAAYADWRGTSLGSITETLERRLILRLAGDIAGRSALDVGCGDGALALTLWQNGAARVVGCDADPRMVGRARARAAAHGAAIDVAIARCERLPFQSASFDVVTIITVLAFVPQPDLALREIARVLKPGGRLVVGDLGKWSLWALSRRIRGWLGAAMWDAARFRTARDLRKLVSAAGLRVEQVCGAVYYPRSALVARLMAPIDPVLGNLTTLGAAFLAIGARKAAAVDVHQGIGGPRAIGEDHLPSTRRGTPP